MDPAWQTVEDGTHGVDHAPEWENDESAHCDDAIDFRSGVIVPDHGEEKYSKDGDAVDGEMGAGEEETDDSRYDDGNEAGRLFFEGHNGIGGGHGVVEESDGDDQVETPPDFGEAGLLWLKIIVHINNSICCSNPSSSFITKSKPSLPNS